MPLFDERKEISFNLADRMRPHSLDEILGQEHLIGKNKPLRKMLDKGEITSLVFWGPPGSGKTSIAYLLANLLEYNFLNYSAVLSGIKEIKEVIADAERKLYLYGSRSILFIDEIHRFNKAQQDAFLPYVEKGTIVLIGATTENPSFAIISPLLSRLQVLLLNPLTEEDIITIINRALTDKENGIGIEGLSIDNDALQLIASLSMGDARFALNVLDFASKVAEDNLINFELVKDILQKQRLLYDKNGEEHYNLISALHKSIRDSDPDGALYWLVRMIEGGEPPLYLARRLVRMAVEDIGLADIKALELAISAKDAYHFLGSPEGELALAELAIYLAITPKSNSVYTAYKKVQKDIREGKNYPVPLHLRNAPTKLMKKLDYSKGYKYAHDFEGHIVNQQHLPDELADRKYYIPSDEGLEKRISERLEFIRKKLGEGNEETST